MSDKIANDFEAIARRMREISGTDQKDLNEANLKEVIDRVAENPEAFGLAPIKREGEPCSIDRTLGVDQAGNAAATGINDLFDQSFDNLTTTTTTSYIVGFATNNVTKWTAYRVSFNPDKITVELA